MVTLTLTGCVVSGNCTISVDVIAIGVSVVVEGVVFSCGRR